MMEDRFEKAERLRRELDTLKLQPPEPPPPVVQDRAYWLAIYPDGNFPLGVLE